MTSLREILRSEWTSLVPATLGSLAVHAVGMASLVWLTVLGGLLGVLFPFCAAREPVVREVIEVSMVALPRSDRNVPDRLARVARATGTEAMEEPPPVKESDLALERPDTIKAGNTEDAVREQKLAEMERQRMLAEMADAPEGTTDRNRTDPHGQEDLDFAVLQAGAVGDPAVARWQIEVKTALQPHFRPLGQGRTDLVCVVIMWMDMETGQITRWEVATSSGVPAYDAAAERAVKDAGILPLPPEKYRALFGRDGVGFKFVPPG